MAERSHASKAPSGRRTAGSVTGGWRKARPDTLRSDQTLIVDYKTTEGPVDALTCERRIADMGLQIQAAAYVDAAESLDPGLRGRVRFIFRWQEQKYASHAAITGSCCLAIESHARPSFQ